TLWVNKPVPWRKATWTPWGAGGLPEVKPLLLPEMPAPPEKVHGEPVGSYWKLPAPTTTCSKPGSPIEGVLAGATAIWSRKAVLSPPALSNPWNLIVRAPAVTVNAAVE